MRVGYQLLILALVLVISTGSPVSAQVLPPENGRAVITSPNPVPAPLLLKHQDELYASAYMDIYRILSVDNPCSQFFGGPRGAVEVFNDLIRQLKKGSLSHNIGLAMSGGFVTITSAARGFSYRLFKKAVINTDGPFYKRQFFVWESSVPNVGSFPPDTREARMLLFLHELAHLIKGRDGQWLIPDDSPDDLAQSRRNTELIEAKCSDQIRASVAVGTTPFARRDILRDNLAE